MSTRPKIEVRFRHSGFIHDLVRDSHSPGSAGDAARCGLSDAQVVARDARWIPTRRRLPRNSRKSPAGQGAETPAYGHASAGPYGHAMACPYTAASRRFSLSPPRPEPQTGRLPLEAALSPYAPAVPQDRKLIRSPAKRASPRDGGAGRVAGGSSTSRPGPGEFHRGG